MIYVAGAGEDSHTLLRDVARIGAERLTVSNVLDTNQSKYAISIALGPGYTIQAINLLRTSTTLVRRSNNHRLSYLHGELRWRRLFCKADVLNVLISMTRIDLWTGGNDLVLILHARYPNINSSESSHAVRYLDVDTEMDEFTLMMQRWRL
jgi:hypothetical protein